MLYSLDVIQAPTIISTRLNGNVINKRPQLDNPILAEAIQKIIKTEHQTISPEVITDLRLLPYTLA